MPETVILRVPAETRAEFEEHWKALRFADALSPDEDLSGCEHLDRFDGIAFAEWIIPLTKTIAPLVTAALGYIMARKGEVEIRAKGREWKFRNLSPSQIKEVMEAMNEAQSRK